ncbi:hypothetical protein [Streptomyces sp. Agncl-13]|uniref:hypothetical protein n=1 Tax=Streptomyces sp. Agncl-13 TaxID=3400628 RepID=UPI003A840917
MSRSTRIKRDEHPVRQAAAPAGCSRSTALRTLVGTAATATRAVLDILTASGFDDFGAGYGPGICLVFSSVDSPATVYGLALKHVPARHHDD